MLNSVTGINKVQDKIDGYKTSLENYKNELTSIQSLVQGIDVKNLLMQTDGAQKVKAQIDKARASVQAVIDKLNAIVNTLTTLEGLKNTAEKSQVSANYLMV